MKTFLSVLSLLTLAGGFAAPAIAQSAPEAGELTLPPTYDSVPNLVNAAFFSESGDPFNRLTIGNQAETIFGFGIVKFIRGTYPENEIERESALVHALYEDLLRQQVASDPVIRTRDLPNPYDSSVLTRYNEVTRFGSTVIPETFQQQPTQSVQPSFTPAPSPTRDPIPALW